MPESSCNVNVEDRLIDFDDDDDDDDDDDVVVVVVDNDENRDRIFRQKNSPSDFNFNIV